MNSDMFDRVERASYDIGNFSKLILDQAIESFNYNGYKAYVNANELSVKNIN